MCCSTCGGTQSPWPGSPVSSFQSPTLMAAWTDVSHTVWDGWSVNWGSGWDLGNIFRSVAEYIVVYLLSATHFPILCTILVISIDLKYDYEYAINLI